MTNSSTEQPLGSTCIYVCTKNENFTSLRATLLSLCMCVYVYVSVCACVCMSIIILN